jgi:D-3-phosphoglycerate dehydrogenase
VSVEAVEAILAYLLRGEIRSAVNVTGLPSRLSPRARAYLDLCSRLGSLLSIWCGSGLQRVTVTTYGETLADIAGTLSWQAFVAVLGPHLETRLSMVNARDQARQRGIAVEDVTQSSQPRFPESVLVTAKSHGQEHSIEGTVFADGRPRVLSIDEYRMEIVPERTMAIIFNEDQPGVIGLVGKKFGDAGINIADMALSRRGKQALMVLKLDTPMPEALRAELRASRPPIDSVHSVTLPAAPEGQTLS